MKIRNRIATTVVASTMSMALTLAGGGSAQAATGVQTSLPDPGAIVAAPGNQAQTREYIQALQLIEQGIVRQNDGTLKITTTAAFGVSDFAFALASKTVEAANERIRANKLTVDDSLNVPNLLHEGSFAKWWGVEYHMDKQTTEELIDAIEWGAAASAIAGLFPMLQDLEIAALIMVFGVGALKACKNSKGVIIYKPWVGPIWCTGH